MRAARDAVVVLAVFLVAGAAAGWLWHEIWAPAPEASGYFVSTGEPVFPSESYIRATGLYALIAGCLGAFLGAALAYLFDRDEVVTVLAVLVGAVAGGHVMAVVGNQLGPDDPPDRIAPPVDLSGIVDALHAEPAVIWTVMPAAAVAGAFAVLLTFGKRRVNADSPR